MCVCGGGEFGGGGGGGMEVGVGRGRCKLNGGVKNTITVRRTLMAQVSLGSCEFVLEMGKKENS